MLKRLFSILYIPINFIGTASKNVSSTGRVGEDLLQMLNSATGPPLQSRRGAQSQSGCNDAKTRPHVKVLF